MIEKVRELLRMYDDGQVSRAEFECRVDDLFVVPFFECVERGETYQRMGSCCCSSHQPDRAFTVEITIHPHGFTVRRTDS